MVQSPEPGSPHTEMGGNLPSTVIQLTKQGHLSPSPPAWCSGSESGRSRWGLTSYTSGCVLSSLSQPLTAIDQTVQKYTHTHTQLNIHTQRHTESHTCKQTQKSVQKKPTQTDRQKCRNGERQTDKRTNMQTVGTSQCG